MTTFEQLNDGWNAEPNAPNPVLVRSDPDLILEFTANGFVYPDFGEDERLQLRFSDVRRFRLGPTNDEGWYRGQCRFSALAPRWGEFYLVRGDLLLDGVPDDWVEVPGGSSEAANHYLFYLRDETFECTAAGWELRRPDPPNSA